MSGDAPEVFRPEVLQLEEVAEKPAGALGDNDRIRLGDALQARRKVWGFTHDPAFLRLPGADDVADHDHAGRDADAHLERFLDGQLADRVSERQSRPDCTLGIVLVRLGIAEIRTTPSPMYLATKPSNRAIVSATHL